MNNELFENLKKNPILHMSLGSKELFHSNFWAWLFEIDKEFVKVFLKTLLLIQEIRLK